MHTYRALWCVLSLVDFTYIFQDYFNDCREENLQYMVK